MISQYFSELTGLWQELDYFQDFQADCSGDAAKFQKLIAKERIYDFFAGLDPEYYQIRVKVLGKDHLPSLQQAYSYVQQEKSRRSDATSIASLERRTTSKKWTHALIFKLLDFQVVRMFSRFKGVLDALVRLILSKGELISMVIL